MALTAIERDLVNRVLITHRRPDMHDGAPEVQIIDSMIKDIYKSEASRHYPWSTLFNVKPNSVMDSPQDNWHGAGKLDGVVAFDISEYNYYRMETRTESSSDEDFQVMYDLRTQGYAQDFVLSRAVQYVDIEFTPPIMQDFVVAASAYRYLSGLDGDQTTIAKAKEDMLTATNALRSYDVNNTTVNDGVSPFMRRAEHRLNRGIR